jgi:hypothetical protein
MHFAVLPPEGTPGACMRPRVRADVDSDFSSVYDLAELGSGLLGHGTGLIGLSDAVGFITKAEDKIVGDPEAPSGGPASGAAKPQE